MDLSIPQIIIYFASFGAIVGVIWFLFEKTEATLTTKSKRHISRWLRSVNPQNAVASWPETFAEVFDHIFGNRHLSRKCFTRSCLASLISVLILTAIWWAIRPTQFKAFWESGTVFEAILSVYLIGIIINLLPDYLSLLETRWLIKKMIEAQRTIRVILFLGIDVFITSLIFLIFIALSMFAVYIVRGIFPNFLDLVDHSPVPVRNLMIRVMELKMTTSAYKEWLIHFLGNSLPLTTDMVGEPSPGIWLYSTFFTSIWAWLYAISGFLAKLGEKLFIGFKWFKRTFDIDHHPLSSMGIIAIIVVFLVYLIVPFLRYIF